MPAGCAEWALLEPEEEERLTELLERVEVPQQQLSGQDARDRRDLLRRAAYHENLQMAASYLQVLWCFPAQLSEIHCNTI